MLYRQGEVLLRKIDELPKNIEKKDNVLAYGEATNHTHRFETDLAITYANPKGNQYVELLGAAELLHDEHSSVNVPEGIYQVIIQRKLSAFDIIKQEKRPVRPRKVRD